MGVWEYGRKRKKRMKVGKREGKESRKRFFSFFSLFPHTPILPYPLFFFLISCSAFETTKITPVPQPDSTWLYESSAIAAFKEGIAVLAVPLNDVKEVDAFAVIVVNQTDHWVSFYKKECVLLDQGGGHAKPLEKSQLSVYLKKNFEPRLPLSLSSEVFRWKRDIVLKGDTGPIPVEDVDKTSVLPGRRSQFYLYFKKQSLSSPLLTLIIPNIKNETTSDKTTFTFRFEIKKG
jgi:hypothetical protein